YGLTHGNCNFYYQDKNVLEKNVNKNLSNALPIYSKKELFMRLIDSNYKVRTASVLFRRELLSIRPPNSKHFLMGDTPMWLDFSQVMKFKYFEEVFAIYRIIPESASRSSDKIKTLKFSMSMAEMRIYYCFKYKYAINEKLQKRYNDALLTYKLFD